MAPMPTLAVLQRELADSIIRNAPLDDIRILLACGAKVNEPVTQGLRPLHYATYQRYTDCVNLLLVRGSDIDAMDDIGYTAIHLCAEKGYYDLLRLFLEHGARVKFTGSPVITGYLGNPPREMLADEPLRLSIKNGHLDCSELLLKFGADANARYFGGHEINLISPLNVSFLELLLRYNANPDSRDRAGLTPLMKACRHPQGYAAAKLLISYGADVNAMTGERLDFRTVLHYAVLSGNTGTVKLLIQHGADVNFPPELQKPTPLDFAILRGKVDMVQLLLDAGANVNTGSPIIGLPLHIALSEKVEQKMQIAQLLLDRGADPNGITFDERGPLLKPPLGEYFNANDDPDPACVKLLLKYGARIILKPQSQDPLGILKCIHRINVDSEVFHLIAANFECLNVTLVSKCPLLNTAQSLLLINESSHPRQLKHLVRRTIRHLLGPYGPFLIEKVADLPLPDLLQRYLLYDVK